MTLDSRRYDTAVRVTTPNLDAIGLLRLDPGGTWAGARTQQVTMSVIRTARQQHVDPINLMLEARLAAKPGASKLLTFPARAAPT